MAVKSDQHPANDDNSQYKEVTVEEEPFSDKNKMEEQTLDLGQKNGVEKELRPTKLEFEEANKSLDTPSKDETPVYLEFYSISLPLELKEKLKRYNGLGVPKWVLKKIFCLDNVLLCKGRPVELPDTIETRM
jgi:hypothetical protein